MRKALSLLVALLLAAAAAAQPVVIANVPDWNQPLNYAAAPDNFAQPPDAPPGPGGGPAGVANWCTPTAAANVMGWYEDTQGATFAGMGDGQAYPAHTVPYPNLDTDGGLADGLPDYQQNQWNDGTIELGYFMDTQGWKTGVGHFGTSFGAGNVDMPQGTLNYLSTYVPSTTWTAWNYDIFDGGNANLGFQDYLSGGTAPTMPPVGPPVPANGVQLGDPVLVCWDHWINPAGANTFTDNVNNITFYDWTASSGLGHCVTGIGYWLAHDPDGPGGPLPLTDWVIVHDNWPGTGHPNTGDVAVPYWLIPSTSTLWQGNMHLQYSGLVPEPTTLALLGLGGLALLRRRRRAA